MRTTNPLAPGSSTTLPQGTASRLAKQACFALAFFALACALGPIAPGPTATLQAADDAARPQRAGGDFQKRLLEEFDADKDGKLDEGERAKARQAMSQRRRAGGTQGVDRQEIIKRFDKDGDGRLNEQERQAAMKAMSDRAGSGARRGKATGAPLDRQELMKRFDKNGNGKLEEDERAAARTAFANRGDAAGRPAGKRDAGAERKRPTNAGPADAGRREEMIKRFDKDGDGKLDESERAAVKAAFAARQGAGRRDDAPATAKPDKRRVDKNALLKEFDADGDGELSAEERQAAKKAFQERTAKAAKE